MWLATRYGGYDYGNVTQNLQSCSQYFLGAVLGINEMVEIMSKTFFFSFKFFYFILIFVTRTIVN